MTPPTMDEYLYTRKAYTDDSRIDLVPDRPDWHAKAACLGMGTDIFYPKSAEVGRKSEQILAEAVALCEECPARKECGEAGMNDGWGVWGGKTASQRRKIRQVRKRLGRG